MYLKDPVLGGENFEGEENNCVPCVCFDVQLVCAGSSPSLVPGCLSLTCGQKDFSFHPLYLQNNEKPLIMEKEGPTACSGEASWALLGWRLRVALVRKCGVVVGGWKRS